MEFLAIIAIVAIGFGAGWYFARRDRAGATGSAGGRDKGGLPPNVH